MLALAYTLAGIREGGRVSRERALSGIFGNDATRDHSFNMLAEAFERWLAATSHKRRATRCSCLASALPYLSFGRLLRIDGANLFVCLLLM